MSVEKVFAVGLIVWAVGAIIALGALAVQNSRTNFRSRVTSEISQRVLAYKPQTAADVEASSTLKAAIEAARRGDHKEAARLLWDTP